MSTITPLNSADPGSTSRVTINTNFTNLNTDKQEKGAGVTGNIPAFGASNVLSDTGKVVPTGAIVGTTDAQTITNKTLNSPIVAVGSDVTGDVYVRSVTGVLQRVAPGLTGSVLASNGVGAVPSFQTPVTAPTGSMQMFAGISAPTGFLMCDGSAVSRATYATLFGVIAGTYGVGDGSTTFNVPDMRGRVPVGVGTGVGGAAAGTGLPTGGSALTAVARGTWKGEETHTLITAEMPSHTHTTNIGSNTGASGTAAPGNATASTQTSSSVGSDGAHNNIQPIMGLNFIIAT